MTLTISRESLVLISICLADAVLTIILVSLGLAVEANPLMARCLQYGVAAFFLAKMATTMPVVALAEWYRKQNPEFVKKTLQMGIAIYIGLYIVAVFIVNIG
jgi:hypothetical protein